MTREDALRLLTWQGKKLYTCRLCNFDSLDKTAFEKHFAARHPPLQVIEGGAGNLKDMTRDELNQVAADAGIKDAEALSTKGDVIAAIESAQDQKEK